VVCYRAGEPWWLETPELEALATIEQAARTVLSDSWEPFVREWLGDHADTTIWEMLAGALGIAETKATNKDQKRVVAVLTALGFTQYRPLPARTESGRRRARRASPAEKV
jgi:predicted P-loop ATPase